MTDWQIAHLFARGARERAEEIGRRRSKGGSPVPLGADGLPTREGMVRFLMERAGMDRAAAEAEYEKQLALTLKMRAEKKGE